jgi:hypothetical protein
MTENSGPLDGLRIPLLVDSALLLTIVFMAGVLWNQNEASKTQIEEVRRELVIIRQNQSSPAARLDALERTDSVHEEALRDLSIRIDRRLERIESILLSRAK